MGNTAAYPIQFATNSTLQATLDASGNLGLGVTPSAWFTGGGYKVMQIGPAMAFDSGTDFRARIAANGFVNSAGDWKYLNTGFASNYSQVSGQHQFYTAASGTAGNAITFTQAMTLDASGQLGIGATSPARTLDVRATSPFIRIQETGSGGDKRLEFSVDSGGVATISAPQSAQVLTFNTVGSERVRIDSSGNLLVGTTSSSPSSGAGFKIQPAGKVYCVSADSANTSESYGMYSTGAANYRFYVGWGGTVYATSTTITAISDQRLKENIRDLDEGLATVMALKPRKFDWKVGKGADIKNARGFIAQEFETVLPDMIETWKDPAPEGEEPYKAINANLIPSLVKAIQEQQAIINQLKARLDAANL